MLKETLCVYKKIEKGIKIDQKKNISGRFGAPHRRLAVAALALALGLAATPAAAEPVTASAALPALAERKILVDLPQFRLGGRYDLDRPDSFARGGDQGTPLEQLAATPLQLGHIALGTPQRNAAGDIINAVVVFSDEWGDATTLYARWVQGRGEEGESFPPPIGPAALIDTDRHFVVLLDGLGLWGTAKPSAGLGPGFPAYSLYDMAQAGYRLLRDHLRVGEVQLVTGSSLGGALAWTLAAMHPDFVHAAMPLAGTTEGDGGDPVARWTLQLMAAAIEADPVWRRSGGRYYALAKADHPNRGVEFAFSLFELFTRGLGAAPSPALLKDVFSWQPAAGEGGRLAERAAAFDAVDLLWRIRAATAFNLSPHLGRIGAPLLAVHAADDPWLIVDKTAEAVRRLPGGELIVLPADDRAGRNPLPRLAGLAPHPAMAAFLERAGLTAEAAADLRPTMPRVSPVAVPGRDFWQAQVRYPFPVETAAVADGAARPWQLAYMDVGGGDGAAPLPPVLLLSDRGLAAAAFGETIAYLARRGVRVIAPDLPPYGRSTPGDGERPWLRTHGDLAAMLTALVRDRLGLDQVACIGQGLGGRLCLALAAAPRPLISRLVLIGPEGLIPAAEAEAAVAALLADPGRWLETPSAEARIRAEMARGPAEIEAALLPAAVGAPAQMPTLFARDSAYARFVSRLRTALATAGRRELASYATAFVYDGEALALPAPALDAVAVPTMVVLGGQAPLPPGAAAALGERLARRAAAGNHTVVRIHEDAGRIVPIDASVAFGRDVLAFLKGQPVTEMTPAILARLLAAAPPAAANDRGEVTR